MSNTVIGAILLVTACLSACVGPVVTGDGRELPLRSAEFAAYVERVFRLQNDVLDRLAFALEVEPEDARLAAFEDRVLGACAGLNEIAVRRRDARNTRPVRDARAAREVPDCESAALAALDWLDVEQD